MTLTTTTAEIRYPESDGQPMGETDLHIYWTIRIADLLKQRYRDQQVYVGCDLIIYPEEGNPKNSIVPDVFLVFDSDPDWRRTFLIWEEGRVPNVVFEVSSENTWRNDQFNKPVRYAEIGVSEIVLFDPEAQFLSPSLQVLRLHGGRYEQVEPDASGRLLSEQLDVFLYRDGKRLVLMDRATALPLLTESETSQQLASHAEEQKNDAIRQKFDAEKRAHEAEAENRRLREILRQNGLLD